MVAPGPGCRAGSKGSTPAPAGPTGSFSPTTTLRTLGKASADADVVEARFIEIVADQRVVQAVDFESDDPGFAGTMTMTWAVDSVRAGTRVRITAADVPAGISAEE